jgi:undecaprenyl-diphosphatase
MRVPHSASVAARVSLVALAFAPAAPGWSSVANLDERLLATIVARRRLMWRRPAAALTELAAPRTVTVVLAACAGGAYRRQVDRDAIASVLAKAGLGILIRRIVAEVVRRQRPPSAWWWAEPSGFSYPSRHTTWATLGYGAAADLFELAGVPRAATRGISFAAVTVVAGTRVLLAVHWPSDVAAAVAYSMSWRFAALR